MTDERHEPSDKIDLGELLQLPSLADRADPAILASWSHAAVTWRAIATIVQKSRNQRLINACNDHANALTEHLRITNHVTARYADYLYFNDRWLEIAQATVASNGLNTDMAKMDIASSANRDILLKKIVDTLDCLSDGVCDLLRRK